jgi:hypothetical protein
MYWKKSLRKRSNGGAARLELRLAICALLVLAATLAEGADKVKLLQQHFDKEMHATSKVKALDKLAEAQFEAAGKAVESGDAITLALIFEKYRDNVQATFLLLKKQEPNADRHPGGYRQLELQARRGLREVTDTLAIAPPDMRPPLEIVRKDLLSMDDELIGLLFPRRTKEPEKVPAVPEENP